MASSKKKLDPLSDRARSLNNEIAALEAEIKKLNSQVPPPATGPRYRSTANPNPPVAAPAKPPPPSPPTEPVFEEVHRNALSATPAPETPELFNELGVRKYDLPALLSRLRSRFSSPPTSNPRLISYLAAGGVQGLRPLRYEKRVARDRFIVLVVVLVVILTGLCYLMLRSH